MPVSPSYFGLNGFVFPTPEGGVCDYPGEGDVRDGVTYGSGGFVGTLELPIESNVRSGISYGEDGTEFTGTYTFFATGASGSDHSPADILRWVLIGIGSLTAPTLNESWPGYCSQEPNHPDNCVTTFDTEGFMTGREQHTGDRLERKGVQIRIRSNTHRIGWVKADEIKATLDQSILRDSITIGSSVYCIQSFRRTSGVIDLGKEVGASKRHLFTINGLLTVTKVS